MPVTGLFGPDPAGCDEYGYGLGTPGGILVLVYRSAGRIEFGESREDFLHQLYWSQDGVLTTVGRFVGPREAIWARRAVTHEVTAAGGQTAVYRGVLPGGPTCAHRAAGRRRVDLAGGRAGLVVIARDACRRPTH